MTANTQNTLGPTGSFNFIFVFKSKSITIWTI